MWHLAPALQRYDWGDPWTIPRLLGWQADGGPVAEAWFGAHPAAPCRAWPVTRPAADFGELAALAGPPAADVGELAALAGPPAADVGELAALAGPPAADVGEPPAADAGQPPAADPGEPLGQIIAADPPGRLGRGTWLDQGRLPYLFKVLAVAHPLSLQVHPSKAQARAGFSREETAGIALTAPGRNYRDRNYKPEMLVALSDFVALAGFRDPVATGSVLDGLATPVTEHLARALDTAPTAAAGLAEAMEFILTDQAVSPQAVDQAVSLARAALADGRDPLGAYSTIVALAADYPGDRGVLVGLLLDRVELTAGEALFVPAGVPHAYLSGTALEIMAASDNVLRAGLTSKHVDAEELLGCLDYERLGAVRVRPRYGGGLVRYRPPVPDFALTTATLLNGGGAVEVTDANPCIVLVLEGQVELVGSAQPFGLTQPFEPTGPVELTQGQAVFIPADAGPVRARGCGRLAVAGLGDEPADLPV